MTPSEGVALEILHPAELHERAAAFIGSRIGETVDRSGRCALALSGGKTPAETFRRLASTGMEWSPVEVFQVDERVVGDGHPDRNLGLIERDLCARVPGTAPRVHPMPVTDDDLEGAAARYASVLESSCGRPPVLDVVHLGLGADGHLASLVPGDPVLEEREQWVALSGPYEGHRRMTLTFPVLESASTLVFVVGGEDRATALARMLEGDPSVPAAQLLGRPLTILADAAAAGEVSVSR